MPDGSLSKDEVAALLTGVAESIMGKEKKRNIHDTSIVLVQYGKNDCTTHVSVHLFDAAGWNSAREYCDKINSLILAGDEWINAKIVKENEIEKLETPYRIDILLAFDDLCIQKILLDIDNSTLRMALSHIDEKISKKIKQNMSKRAVQMLEEDIVYMGPIRLSDVMSAQKKILDTVSHLEETGEIVITREE